VYLVRGAGATVLLAFLLGDAVECPLRLTEPDFYALSDVDPLVHTAVR
jgi:hypothetical protein